VLDINAIFQHVERATGIIGKTGLARMEKMGSFHTNLEDNPPR